MAFETLNLTGDHGWKHQIEAAERLKKSGALADNRFLGILTDQDPAASGGIWDRVALVQAFERALKKKDTDALSTLIVNLWTKKQYAPLRSPLSRLFSNTLPVDMLTDQAQPYATSMGMLSKQYKRIAKTARWAQTKDETTLKLAGAIALENFDISGLNARRDRELIKAFHAVPAPASVRRLVSEHKLGEAILQAIALFQTGSQGSRNDLIRAIAALRYVGLGETAERAVLYYLILGDSA